MFLKSTIFITVFNASNRYALADGSLLSELVAAVCKFHHYSVVVMSRPSGSACMGNHSLVCYAELCILCIFTLLPLLCAYN